MSFRMMTRRCTRCHRIYAYNPSVGDLGLVCPHCHKPQALKDWGPWKSGNSPKGR